VVIGVIRAHRDQAVGFGQCACDIGLLVIGDGPRQGGDLALIGLADAAQHPLRVVQKAAQLGHHPGIPVIGGSRGLVIALIGGGVAFIGADTVAPQRVALHIGVLPGGRQRLLAAKQLHHFQHRGGVDPGRRHGAHGGAVGGAFLGPCVGQEIPLRRAAGAHRDAAAGLGAAGRRDGKAQQHAKPGGGSRAAGIRGAAEHVAVGDMGKLVGQHRLQLGRAVEPGQQAGMDEHMPAVDHEGIERRDR
jgi:hypothetical protein